jgi:Mg-chelatase subunit ChlD
LSTSTAQSNNLVTKDLEHYISIGLTSKYDGEGIKVHGRSKCKIVIVFDISGSMSAPMSYSNHKSKMEVAKSVMKSMLEKIKDDDYYSLVVFDDCAEIIQPLMKYSEIERDMLELQISKINNRGGTNFELGFKKAYEIL